MLDTVTATLHMLLSALGVLGSVDLTALGGMTGALALTIAMISATVVLLAVVTMTHASSGGTSPPHPRRAIDVSSPLTQSDPDAPGHPRPRAPQSVASAT